MIIHWESRWRGRFINVWAGSLYLGRQDGNRRGWPFRVSHLDPRNHEFRYVSILDWSNHWIWGYIHFRKEFLFFIHRDSWFWLKNRRNRPDPLVYGHWFLDPASCKKVGVSPTRRATVKPFHGDVSWIPMGYHRQLRRIPMGYIFFLSVWGNVSNLIW